jgi:hypothetical protein
MLIAPTPAVVKEASNKTLKFKILYFDGVSTKESGLLTRLTSITCFSAFSYKIDDVVQATVFTTDPGIITTTDDYKTSCFKVASITTTCD